ncbi:family 78 glycoside hydrolase catalytic domain [Micromonospora echinospora]|uniref:family 78 glycoside hydrolase catalytic domain n=1 Tax=Micromonospora echinospora TaxID=1877 RepID=UPI00366B672B
MPACLAPTDLRVEHWLADETARGIGTAVPRLSWVVPDADPDFVQTTYEIEVRHSSGDVQVHRVDSADQVLVPWPAEPLHSRDRVTLRVRVRGTEWSPWSAGLDVEIGLLSVEDWSARFVSPASIGETGAPAPLLSRTFTLDDDPADARLHLTAHGTYIAFVNGVRVGDDVLAPGWTSYHHRLRYQTHDVTQLLKPGENRISVLLGNGWFRGRLGWLGARAFYGDRLALLAQLELTVGSGERHVIATDESWVATPSATLADDLYDGEYLDLRRGDESMVEAGDETSVATAVEIVEADLTRLVGPDGPPVRVTEIIPAAHVTISPSGRTLVDFGQNLVGWVRLRVRGLAPGAEVMIRHAEVLEDGELSTRPLRSALATDRYLVAGDAEEVLEPRLTFHGFRYAEITGVRDLLPADLEAVVIGTAQSRAGWFESSDPLLDKLHANVVWSMRGNFLDIPTDCPQRDERMGWTGDIGVFAPTAAFLYHCSGLLTSWLADLAADQLPSGAVPLVVPDVLRDTYPSAAAWGDAAVLVPWAVYQRAGDADLLARQLPSMRGWVDYVARLAGPSRLWTGGFQYGDWLDPTAPPDAPARAQTHPDVVATACFARSTDILAKAAGVVGDREMEAHYADLAGQIREAFAAEYVTAHGRVLSDAPTAYAMAICWDLLPTDAQRTRAGERLADLVRSSAFRISTGFVGTPLICDALTRTGRPDLAYRLLLQTSCPSWLYPVTMGASTIWERWDSMLPDGSVNPGSMTSFNHYALGAVADWLHRSVAGLAPLAAGYRTISIAPVPTPDLTHAAATHRTPYGTASSRWRRAGGRLVVEADVPVGTTAVVHLPGTPDPFTVGHGHHQWQVPDCPTSQPPTRTSTVRELIDHTESWQSLIRAGVESGVVGDDVELAARLAPYLDAPATALVVDLTCDHPAPGAEALQANLDQILSRS